MPRIYSIYLMLGGVLLLIQALWASEIQEVVPFDGWKVAVAFTGLWLIWQSLAPEIAWRRHIGGSLVLTVGIWRATEFLAADLPWERAVSAATFWMFVTLVLAGFAFFGWVRNGPSD